MRTISYPYRPDHRQTGLLVMLPGINNSPTAFAAAGMTATAQAASGVDILAVDASLKYYLDYSVVQRLHDEVIAPAKSQGYQRIWLVGTSMGGFGCLLYAQRYPADITGLVLLSPFLGEGSLQAELTAAGGLAHWQYRAGSGKDIQDRKVREIWHWLQQNFLANPGGDVAGEARPKIWLAWGNRDKFRLDASQLAAIMPPSQVLNSPGSHDWKTWAGLFSQLLSGLDLPPRQPGP